jgi:hypothetical protein
MERTNKEGLTLQEWLAAAGAPDADLLPGLLVAWDDGEDPTEYRADPAPPGDPEAVAKEFLRSHAERAAVDACVSEEDVEISYERVLSGWVWVARVRYTYASNVGGKALFTRSCAASSRIAEAVDTAVSSANDDCQRVL